MPRAPICSTPGRIRCSTESPASTTRTASTSSPMAPMASKGAGARMRTWGAGIPEPEPSVSRARQSGFTFIEIIAVVMLIALVSALLVTRLSGRTSAPLKASGRFLCAELEYVAQRAIATGHPQRWLLDLDSQHFRIEEQIEPPPAEQDASGELDLAPTLPPEEWEPITEPQGEWRELYETSVGIDSVVLSGEALKAGQAAIHFAPDGGADPADLTLVDEENRTLRVVVTAFTGEVRMTQDEPGA